MSQAILTLLSKSASTLGNTTSPDQSLDPGSCLAMPAWTYRGPSRRISMAMARSNSPSASTSQLSRPARNW